MNADRCLRSFEQPLFAALQFQGELGDRCVGNHFKGIAEPTSLTGGDLSIQGNIDLAVKSGDQIGETTFIFRCRTQIYRTFQWFPDQRCFGLGKANYRSGRTFSPGLAPAAN